MPSMSYLRDIESPIGKTSSMDDFPSFGEEARQQGGGIILDAQRGFESFVVAIDAGGSGCKAVLMSKSGQYWSGQSGSCNVLTMETKSVMATVSESLQQAVNAHPTLASRPFRSVSISYAWIGMAGYGRPASRPLIREMLIETLGLQEGRMLHITSDIDLLAAAVPNRPMVKSAIALIAGTGSIARSFKREDDHLFIPVARVGGWGHTLGDDGSGYWLGRMGLRAALASLDLVNLRRASENDIVRFKTCDDTLVERILAYLALCNPSSDPKGEDIISHAATYGVKGVAAFAKVTLDAYTTSVAAQKIVDKGAKSLAEMVEKIVSEQRIDSSNTILMLSGGLINNTIYERLIKERLAEKGVSFLVVQAVQNPALAAAEWLRLKM